MQEVSQKAEKEEMENRKIIKWKPNVQIIEVPGRVKEKKEKEENKNTRKISKIEGHKFLDLNSLWEEIN